MKRPALLLCLLAAAAPAARAKVLLGKSEALALAFPDGVHALQKTAFLDEEQAARAQALAKARLEERVWTYYVGMSSGRPTGYVYFDRVVVRTMPAILMAAVDTGGNLRFLEVVSFEEPEDYLPGKRWLALFEGKNIADDLRPRGVIRNVSGATLTSETFSRSARRMLAVHAVLHPPPPPPSAQKK